jgi:hypothetical protein
VPPDLRQFVEGSLDTLAREAPAFHSRLCVTLLGRRLRVRGDGEPFALHFGRGLVASVPPDGSEDLHLSVDRRSLLALVDGELTLEDALRQDRLELRGDLRHVVDLFDGLLIYLRGGIRCPSFPQLLSDFRASKPAYEVSR